MPLHEQERTSHGLRSAWPALAVLLWPVVAVASAPVLHRTDAVGEQAQPASGTGEAGDWVAPPVERARANPVTSSEENLKRGRSLFRRHCSVCHGNEGRGDGPAARPHSRRARAPRNLTQADVQARLTDGEIFWKITNGFRKGRQIVMPAFQEDISSDEDRWKIVHFVRTLLSQGTGSPRR